MYYPGLSYLIFLQLGQKVQVQNLKIPLEFQPGFSNIYFTFLYCLTAFDFDSPAIIYTYKIQSKIHQNFQCKELILIKIFLMQVLMIERGNKCAITASSDTRDTRTLTPTSWCYKYNRGFPLLLSLLRILHLYSFMYICVYLCLARPS
jgi:hypothetical protein